MSAKFNFAASHCIFVCRILSKAQQLPIKGIDKVSTQTNSNKYSQIKGE